jgi:hypothetical protein
MILSCLVFYSACNNKSDSKESKSDVRDSFVQNNGTDTMQNSAAELEKLVAGYIILKNALTNDNGKEAASAANNLQESLAAFSGSGLIPAQKKVYDGLREDIQEHAEHIGSNGSNIAHQREHFALLSQDMIDLINVTGSAKTLYKDFCPMYNNKKGASWLSETKEIRNPYYGKEMISCGELKEEIRPKE